MDAATIGTFLDLPHKLSQLCVCSTAVVNLEENTSSYIIGTDITLNPTFLTLSSSTSSSLSELNEKK